MPRQMWPEVSFEDVPALTASQMREVDRIMVEELGIGLVQMMENAGRALADLALGRFHPASVLVLAGPGGNGGGGLVAARHLSNRGSAVTVALSHDERDLAPVTAMQLEILTRMGIELTPLPRAADVVIDASATACAATRAGGPPTSSAGPAGGVGGRCWRSTRRAASTSPREEPGHHVCEPTPP